jgi:hypothetical protein
LFDVDNSGPSELSPKHIDSSTNSFPNFVFTLYLILLGVEHIAHITREKEMRYAHKMLVGKPEGQPSLGRLGLGRVILKWISQKCGLKVLTEFN